MQKIISAGVIVLTSLLTACSTPVDLDAPRSASPSASSSASGSMFSNTEYRCDADPAQVLVGKTFSESVEEQARSLSGSKFVRPLRPGQVITMEYNPERINLRLDESDVITTVGCG